MSPKAAFLLGALWLTAPGNLFASGLVLQRYRDPRVRIAVIDTGMIERGPVAPYLCQDGHEGPHVDITGQGIEDKKGHGTNILGIISRYMDPVKECFVVVKWYHTTDEQNSLPEEIAKTRINRAFQAAVAAGAKFINFSGYSPVREDGLYETIQRALRYGIVISVAAGNDHRDLGKDCYLRPACYLFDDLNFHVVENRGPEGLSEYSNYGGPVTDSADGERVEGFGIVMSGTSQATAIITGQLVQQARRRR